MSEADEAAPEDKVYVDEAEEHETVDGKHDYRICRLCQKRLQLQ
jgi:hypothetical protein